MPSIRFSIDASDSTRGAREYSSAVDRIAADARRAADAVNSVGAQLDRFNGAIGAVQKVLSGLGTALDGLFAGIERGNSINQLSQRLGVSVKTLSDLDLAAKVTGVSLDSMAVGIQRLDRQMSLAEGGSKAAATAFAAVGIKAGDIAKLNTEDVLKRIAEKFATSADGANKTAAAMALLGRSGAQFIPVLNLGSDGLQRFISLSQQLGTELTSGQAQALHQISANWIIFQSAIAGVKQQLAIGLSPALTGITEAMVAFVTTLGIGNGQVASFGLQIGEALTRGVIAGISALQTFVTTVQESSLGTAVIGLFSDTFKIVAENALSFGALIAANLVLSFTQTLNDMANDLPGSSFWTKLTQPLEQSAAQVALNVESQIKTGASLGPVFAAVGAGLDAAKNKLVGYDGYVLANNIHTAAWAQTTNGATGAIGALAKGASSAKSEIEKATDAVQKSTLALKDKAEIDQAQTAATLDGIKAGDDWKTIQGDIAQAAIDVETAQKLATGATLDSVEAWRAEAEAALGTADAKKQAAAAGDAVKENELLTQQVAIWGQVRDGALSVAQAHHQIAVAAELAATGNVELSNTNVTLKEQAKTLTDEYDKEAKAGIKMGEQIDQAFDQTIDGLINGTLKMSDIWKSFATGMVKQMVTSLGGVTSIFESFLSGLFKLFTDASGSFDLSSLFSSSGSVLSLVVGGGGSAAAAAATGDGAGSYGVLLSDAAGGATSRAAAPSFLAGGSPILLNALLNSGGFFANSNPGLSLGLSGASLLSSGLSLTTGTGLVGTLFGASASSATIGSFIGNTGSGLVTSLFGDSGNAASLLGTSIGDVASGVGGVVGGAGGVYSAYQLGQGGQSSAQIAASLVSIVAGAAAVLNSFPIIGTIIYAILVAIAAIVGVLTKFTPTDGSVLRKQSEGILDSFKTFQELQKSMGDITENMSNTKKRTPAGLVDNYMTGSETAASRGFTPEAQDAVAAFAGIFAQKYLSNTTGLSGNGNPVLLEASQQTNVLAEFFSRAKIDAKDFATFTTTELMKAFKEAGITLEDSLKMINGLSQTFNKVAAMGNDITQATGKGNTFGVNVAQDIRGVGAIFESDTDAIPPGVHIAALAVEELEKDGVKAFDKMDGAASDFFVKLSEDSADYDKVVNELLQQGFTINTDELKARLQDIIASAKEVGASFSGLFSAPTFEQGIQGMVDHLKQTLQTQLSQGFMDQLFGKTNFAGIFEPVFAALDKMKDFDLTKASGQSDFMSTLLPAIAQGKENLQTYLPILRQMYDEWKEINKEVDDALAPSKADILADAVTKAFSGVGQIFSDAIQAGMAVIAAGGTQSQAVDAFNLNFKTKFEATIKQAIFNGLLDTAIIAPFIAMWEPAFKYVASAGLIYGFTDPRVIAAMATVTAQAEAQAAGLGDLLVGSGAAAWGVVSDQATQFFAKVKTDIVSLNQSLGSGLANLLKESIDVGYKDGAEAGQKHFDDGLGKVIYDVVFNALITAFINALMAQSQLGPIIEQGAALYAAAVDAKGPGGKTITPAEQAGLDAWKTMYKGAAADFIKAAKDAGDYLFGANGVFDLPGPDGTSGSGGGPHAGQHLETRGGDVVWVPDSSGGTPAIPGGGTPATGAQTGDSGGTAGPGEMTSPTSTGVPAATQQYIDSTKGASTALDLVTDALGDAQNALSGVAYASQVLIGLLSSAVSPTPGTTTATDTTTSVTDTILSNPTQSHPGQHVESRGGDIVWVDDPSSSAQTFASAQSVATPAKPPGTTTPGGGDGTTSPTGHRGYTNPGGIHTPGGGGVGWGGSPFVGPDDDRNPANQTRAGAVAATVSIDTSSISDFLKGGSINDFEKALDDATKKAILDGLVAGMLASGPIKNAIDKYNKALGDATTKAMKDGVIDASEAANLEDLGKKYGKGIEDSVKAARPSIDAVMKALGLGAAKAAKDAISGIANDLSSAIRSFLEGGSTEDMEKAINKSVYEGTTSAIIQALITTGPLGAMIEAFGNRFGEAIAKATDPDGPGGSAITEKEQKRLNRIATKYGTDISSAIEALGPILGPMFLKWAKDFGIDLGTSVASAGPILSNALKTALQQHQSLAQFKESVKQGLYESILDGLVKAFIDSAIINGLLSGPLGVIMDVFDKVGKGQLTIAQANIELVKQAGIIAGIADSQAFKDLLKLATDSADAIAAGLGITTDAAATAASGLNGTADAANAAADAANNACTGECALQQKLIDQGSTTLNDAGREGDITDKVYGPGSNGGGGASGGGDGHIWRKIDHNQHGGTGTYGDPNWVGDPAENKYYRQERRQWNRTHFYDPQFGGPGGNPYDDPLYLPPGYSPPKMAAGGIVTRPTFALIGEAGPEAVIPLGNSGADGSELVDEVKGLRDDVKRLSQAIADQDITVKAQVGEVEFAQATAKAFRTAKLSGIRIGG